MRRTMEGSVIAWMGMGKGRVRLRASAGWSVSMGAAVKANTRELVQAAGGLLERLQRDVALDALSESSSSLGTEPVALQTASTGAEAGAESVNGR